MMKATEFEFRNRFWLIGLIFGLGFAAYAIDPVDIVAFALDHTIGHDSPRADSIARICFSVGALLAIGAALIRTWAAAYLQTDVVQDSKLRHEHLVADGPYRHLRNPLYFGNDLLALALSLLASRIGFFIIVIGIPLFGSRLIALEESNLEREQGESYREFCRRVPRIWPSLRPRVPASGAQPRWGQAILGELFMWGFALGVVAFAVTLDIKYTWILTGLALGTHIVRSYIVEARRKQARPQ
jgi:protein-S-isoprenylcysteine O-methyltransferase Ste14